MAEYKDLTGFIFKRTDSSYQGGNGYWKIICLVEDNNNRYAAYSTIKCTKTGKEFDTTNRFSVEYIMKKFNAGEMFKAKTDEDVSTAGRPSGVRKNRINYLQAKIAEFINELNALNKLENKNVVYELMSILDKE